MKNLRAFSLGLACALSLGFAVTLLLPDGPLWKRVLVFGLLAVAILAPKAVAS